jgi:UDP-glucose:(heptosyl)LPS alpha-1,3-glucosyltransferase
MMVANTMKIALIVRKFYLAGGISRYVVELARNYANGNEVHVYAARIDQTLVPNVVFHRVPMYSSAFLKRRKLFAVNNIFEVVTFMFCARCMLFSAKFDIIHSQGDYTGASHLYTAHSCHKAWLRLYRSSKPGIFGYLMKSPINPLHMLLLFVEKMSVIHSRRFIAISNGIKRELMECYGVPADKISVIPNGVNTDEFNPALKKEPRNRVRNLYGIRQDDFVIIFPAHEFQRKGLTELIRVVAGIKMPSMKVLVVGRDAPRPFMALAEAEGCADRIIFAGSATRMGDFFNASDVLVFPTVYEPFGLIITEAMASGIPAVVSRSAGAAELITDGVDGLLIQNPRDVVEIRRHILTLYNDVSLRKSMGAAARVTALKYSWANISAMTMSAYSLERG